MSEATESGDLAMGFDKARATIIKMCVTTGEIHMPLEGNRVFEIVGEQHGLFAEAVEEFWFATLSLNLKEVREARDRKLARDLERYRSRTVGLAGVDVLSNDAMLRLHPGK